MSISKFLKSAKAIEEQHHKRRDELRPSAAEGDESNWLVSYADMMTLLCGFFIMLFSMAKLDEPQYERVKEALSKQFGGEYKTPAKDMARYVSQIIRESGLEKTTTVHYDSRGVAITFESMIFFETSSAEVKPAGKIILSKLIDAISTRQASENKEYRLAVEGHTDSRPVVGGDYPSNWELSGARASRVVRMFLDHGFKPNRLTSIGYADTQPDLKPTLADGSWDEEALNHNRRVVVRILEPTVDGIPYPDTAKALAQTLAEGTVESERAPAAVSSAAPATLASATPAAAVPATEPSPVAAAVPEPDSGQPELVELNPILVEAVAGAAIGAFPTLGTAVMVAPAASLAESLAPKPSPVPVPEVAAGVPPVRAFPAALKSGTQQRQINIPNTDAKREPAAKGAVLVRPQLLPGQH